MKKTHNSGFYFIHTSLPKNGLIDDMKNALMTKIMIIQKNENTN
jgi:hypothetical protein